MYPTRRMIGVVLVGIPLSLVAAALAPSSWILGPIWIAFAIGLFLLDVAMSPRASALSWTVQTPGSLGIRRSQAATIALRFSGIAPQEVELAVGTGSRLQAAPQHQSCVVEGGTANAPIMLTPLRRGAGVIEMIAARWRGPLGLCWRQHEKELLRSIPIIPNIALVKEEAMRLFRRESGQMGARVQLRAGDGADFHALREFQTGMDRRSIDWKQSARHGRLFAREFQAEENLHIVFAVDTGRLMCEPLAGVPRIDRAIQALLLLSFVALRLGDRVGLFAFDEKPVLSSGTVSGANAFGALQHLAASIDYSTAETNFTLALSTLSAELEHRSIIVVFTDFFDTVSAELMIENVRRLLVRHAVLFVTFRDEELEDMAKQAPRQASDVSRAVLSDSMLRERESVLTRLKRLGVDVVDAPIEQINMHLIDAYLSIKHARS
jgi:uncharacterized protein (DUF58 family)